MGSLRYLAAALRHRLSLLLVGAGAVATIASGSDAPLLLAAGAELVFVGLISGNARFRRAVDAKEDRRDARRRARRNERLLAGLAPAQREHFLGLQALGERILESFERMEGGEAFAAQSRQRIESLLQAFLRLLICLDDHRRFLGSTDRRQIEREKRELEEDLARERGGEAVREIKQRRVAILERRLERFEKAAESREVIGHQLASIEDLLHLLHEQAITLRDPGVITRQLDVLSIEVEEAEATMRELDRLLASDLELRALGERAGR